MQSEQGPRILFIVDRPQWAHDFKTKSLQRALASECRTVRRYAADVTAADLDQADLVVIYYWLQIETLGRLDRALRRNRQKLLLGICSHFELEGRRREEGLAVLRHLARAIFVNNLLLHHEFHGRFDCAVFYTPNGVDTHFFQPGPARHAGPTLHAGWAGSLSNQTPAHRGVHDVIVPAVDSVSGARLVTATREEHWRDEAAMRDFYQSLDVYLCASRSEGTPNTCLEAAACGVPVITTRVGNMPELIVDGVNGFFVERDPREMAARLMLLRDDPALRERMGVAMQKSIAAWDWTIQAEHYRHMFVTVLADAKSGGGF